MECDVPLSWLVERCPETWERCNRDAALFAETLSRSMTIDWGVSKVVTFEYRPFTDTSRPHGLAVLSVLDTTEMQPRYRGERAASVAPSPNDRTEVARSFWRTSQWDAL